MLSSLAASLYWQTVSFLSHLWHGQFPSHRTFDVRQLTHALIARLLRGRSCELESSIGNFVRKVSEALRLKRNYSETPLLCCGGEPSIMRGRIVVGSGMEATTVGNRSVSACQLTMGWTSASHENVLKCP
jgi:hypothetical protein